MFYNDRETVAKTLEDLRFDLCCYMSRNFCDCKYGYESKGQLAKMHPGYVNHGEETGCPELRTVIALLNLLTDEEYKAIMKREPHNMSHDDILAALKGGGIEVKA